MNEKYPGLNLEVEEIESRERLPTWWQRRIGPCG